MRTQSWAVSFCWDGVLTRVQLSSVRNSSQDALGGGRVRSGEGQPHGFHGNGSTPLLGARSSDLRLAPRVCVCVCVCHQAHFRLIVVSRDDCRQPDVLAFQPSANHGEAVVGGANEQLGEAGGGRSEVKLLAPEAANSSATPQTQSWSRRRRVVSPVLEEAERVLHQVQRQKKVLEENLQALERARSAELLYNQMDALVDALVDDRSAYAPSPGL